MRLKGGDSIKINERRSMSSESELNQGQYFGQRKGMQSASGTSTLVHLTCCTLRVGSVMSDQS